MAPVCQTGARAAAACLLACAPAEANSIMIFTTICKHVMGEKDQNPQCQQVTNGGGREWTVSALHSVTSNTDQASYHHAGE